MPFTRSSFQFLEDLKENNASEWFKAHRDRYEAHLHAPALAFAEEVLALCDRKGLPFRGEPRKCLFRLNRDVRFSKDKSPFKTHVGIVFTPTGDKDAFGLGYVHLSPEETFVAGGFWCPEPPKVKRFRDALAKNPEPFLAAVRSLERAKWAFDREPELELKRLPRGYELHAGTPVADFLRRKSWTVTRKLTRADAVSASFAMDVVKHFEKCLPLLDYGWKNVSRAHL